MNKWFFLGFGLGALVGASTGLLTAPVKGNETRRRVIESTRPARVRLGSMRVHFGAKEHEGAKPIRQAI